MRTSNRVRTSDRREGADRSSREGYGSRSSNASPVARAPRRFNARLSSARDRQRLAERNSRERERVERMLAAAPSPVEAPVEWIDAPRALSPVFADPQPSPHVGALVGCPICDSTEIVFDEVVQVGTLRLLECGRCDHRWTRRGPGRWAEVGATMKSRRGSRAPLTLGAAPVLAERATGTASCGDGRGF